MSQKQIFLMFGLISMAGLGLYLLVLPYMDNVPADNIISLIGPIPAILFVALPAFYNQITSGDLKFKGWHWYAGLNVLLMFLNVVLNFAALYKLYGLSENGKVTHDGLVSLYFSVVTWTTLGYGDISPVGYSRLIAAIEAISGQVGLVAGIIIFSFIWQSSLSRKSDFS